MADISHNDRLAATYQPRSAMVFGLWDTLHTAFDRSSGTLCTVLLFSGFGH